jgi:hypothetical protein
VSFFSASSETDPTEIAPPQPAHTLEMQDLICGAKRSLRLAGELDLAAAPTSKTL